MKKLFNSKIEIPVHVINNGIGLRFEFLAESGALRRIGLNDVMLNLFLGHPIEGGVANIFIRVFDGGAIRYIPVTGPESESRFTFSENAVFWEGDYCGLKYSATFTVSSRVNAWFYEVAVTNVSGKNIEFDVVYIQDKGVSDEFTIRINEAYTSQYIDQKVFQTEKYGPVVAARQNNPFNGRCPWVMDGCLDGSSGFLTDGLQFYGLRYKETNIPQALFLKEWKSEILQDEFSITALKSRPRVLKPGQKEKIRYFAFAVEDHKEATNDGDLALLSDVEKLCEEAIAAVAKDNLNWRSADRSVFNNIRFLKTGALTGLELNRYFGKKRRLTEISGGNLLSFFTDRSHVVLKEKDLILPRAHGNIIRAGKELYPQTDVLATSNYIYGGFNLHLSVGNTSFDQLLSHPRSLLNILKASGQRIFIKGDGGYEMLGLPSAYEMGLTFARWIYKGDKRVVEVKAWTDPDDPVVYIEASVIKGRKAEFLISHEVTLGGAEYEQRGRLNFKDGVVEATPEKGTFLSNKRPDAKFFISAERKKIEKIGMDELLYDSGKGCGLPYIVFKTKEVDSFRIAVGGSVESEKKADALARSHNRASFEKDTEKSLYNWRNIFRHTHLELPGSGEADKRGIEKIDEILFWYLHNAGVHFTVPFGLEQYKGGAWGVRDVLQGPVEAFLALRQYGVVKELLIKVFSAQFIETGGWPQWFMFDIYKEVQLPESHGDIIVWPFKAVCEYIEATADFSILEEKIPYTKHYDPAKSYTGEKETICGHLLRAVEFIKRNFIPGTYLSIYGGGDWDDTLQPAHKELRERMASGWTVSITYQYLKEFAEILKKSGKSNEAAVLSGLAENIRKDYHKYFIKDGVASGFIYLDKEGNEDYMLHPSDNRTHINYRLLPMTRGMISGIFTREEAQSHYKLICEYLDCPDGVRLMDKTVPYSGGPIKWFRRAEMAANFGREIGLMYVHAALRYAEALAKIGKADELFSAVQKLVPIMIKDAVKNAVPRQSNTYFSSSDGDFKTRYEVDFSKLKKGTVKAKGGWRIYSSGPGLFIHEILNNFLGIRFSFGNIVIDPVIPTRLDGLTYRFDYSKGKVLKCVYRTGGKNSFGVRRVTLNGKELKGEPVSNPYRKAGVQIPVSVFEKRLKQGVNSLVVTL